MIDTTRINTEQYCELERISSFVDGAPLDAGRRRVREQLVGLGAIVSVPKPDYTGTVFKLTDAGSLALGKMRVK